MNIYTNWLTHLPPLTHTFLHVYSLSFICTHFPSFVLTSFHLYSLTFTLVPYMWASIAFLPKFSPETCGTSLLKKDVHVGDLVVCALFSLRARKSLVVYLSHGLLVECYANYFLVMINLLWRTSLGRIFCEKLICTLQFCGTLCF